MSTRLTLQEMLDAAAWAEAHVRNVHGGMLTYADLRVFSLPSCGIGMRTVIVCEACDRIRVSNNNMHDVTDYTCW